MVRSLEAGPVFGLAGYPGLPGEPKPKPTPAISPVRGKPIDYQLPTGRATRSSCRPDDSRNSVVGSRSLWRPRPRELHVNRFSEKSPGDLADDGDDTNAGSDDQWPGINGPTLRWGIAPVSLMADDFAAALSVLPPQHHRIVSCVAAYQSHALAFADRHKVKNVYTSFEDLARCPDVDVVYISPLNPQHSELCHLMLNHDKHVLCEKPLCMTEEQVLKLLDKANARGLFLMEGMWPRCVPAYRYLRHQILRNRLGELQHIHCTLGLPVSNSRLALYGGVTSDFGVYGMQLALWVFREVPRCLKVSGKVNSENVDVAANIEMCFSHCKQAFIEVSSEKRLDNMAIIQGKEGSIKMGNYWCPTRLITDQVDYEFPLPGGEEVPATHYHNRVGMCYEAEEVRNCILKGNNESNVFSHSESLLLANLMDTIHAELGVGEFAAAVKSSNLQEEVFSVRDAVQDPEELDSETCRVVQDVNTGETLPSNKAEEEVEEKQNITKALDAP